MKKQSWTSQEVLENVEYELHDLIKEGVVKVIIIPDIESVNYGRGVGYEIIEHEPSDKLKEYRCNKYSFRNEKRW